MDGFGNIPKSKQYQSKPNIKLIHYSQFPNNILNEVTRIKGFAKQKIIEADQFSSTIAVQDDTEEKFAVKVVPDDKLGENEKLWENLHHEHVLTLTNYEYLSHLEVHLFYSNVPSFTLKDLIAEKNFRQRPDSISKLTRWFQEAASGIQYIHKSGYQHLNISSNNIAIAVDETVKIKGFHYLQHETKRADR